jgi:hypothetical protein
MRSRKKVDQREQFSFRIERDQRGEHVLAAAPGVEPIVDEDDAHQGADMPKGDPRGYRSWRVSRRISAQKGRAEARRKERRQLAATRMSTVITAGRDRCERADSTFERRSRRVFLCAARAA